MSWVNLDDVYVNKSGDSIAGNLSVGGALTINDAKGTGGMYNVANEITTLRDSVSRAPRVFVGNKIVNFSNQSYTLLWDDAGFKREFGRSFDNSRDSVYAMNGDASYDFMVSAVNYYPRNKQLVVAISGAHTGGFRVNYIVALG